MHSSVFDTCATLRFVMNRVGDFEQRIFSKPTRERKKSCKAKSCLKLHQQNHFPFLIRKGHMRLRLHAALGDSNGAEIAVILSLSLKTFLLFLKVWANLYPVVLQFVASVISPSPPPPTSVLFCIISLVSLC